MAPVPPTVCVCVCVCVFVYHLRDDIHAHTNVSMYDINDSMIDIMEMYYIIIIILMIV
jgi:hypothetical protein